MLGILDSGTYFVPFASSFSFPQPGIVMVEDGCEMHLRRPETFEHMTALDEGLVSRVHHSEPGAL